MRISSASSIPSMVSIPWATNWYFEGSVWMRHISREDGRLAFLAIPQRRTYCAVRERRSSTFDRRYGSCAQLQRRRSNDIYLSFITLWLSLVTWLLKRRETKSINHLLRHLRDRKTLPGRWHEISPADILRYQHQRFCPSDQSEYE